MRRRCSNFPLLQVKIKVTPIWTSTLWFLNNELLSLEPELDEEKYNGKYFADCKLTEPDKRYAYGKQEADQLAENLWKASEEITNSKFVTS